MSTITNLDPKPWVLKITKMRVANPSEWGHLLTGPNDGRHFKYDPRPEFDVGDNPLLEIFADTVEHLGGVEPVAVLVERFLGERERYAELVSVPERRYAEEVLERIVAASA